MENEITTEDVQEDEVYFTIEIRRSDVEARFAETGTPAKPRRMELIGDCLRETPVELLKDVILTELLASAMRATRLKLAEKEAERTEQCQVETL